MVGLFFIVVAGAGMTAFYMFRLWFMTFAGKPRDDHLYEHAHESPMYNGCAAGHTCGVYRCCRLEDAIYGEFGLEPLLSRLFRLASDRREAGSGLLLPLEWSG